MPTYLYCVIAPPRVEALPEGLRGIADSPIRALVAGESGRAVEAWVATIDEAALRVRGRALAAQALVHNEVVNAALATGRTPAPARYGSRFTDDASCVADLSRRASELNAVFDLVAGAVEMSVLLVPSDVRRASFLKLAPGERAAGRRYLESVRFRTKEIERRRAEAAAEAEVITTLLGRLTRGEVRSYALSGVMSIAHLVSIEEVEAYRRVVARYHPRGSFRIIVGDPRAPYSFVNQKTAPGGHESGSPNRNE